MMMMMMMTMMMILLCSRQVIAVLYITMNDIYPISTLVNR
jgi:hypothetical protein